MKSFFLTLSLVLVTGCAKTNDGTCTADTECGSTSRCCNKKCVDVTGNVNHCGACFTVCSPQNGTASCTAGSCAVACNSGFGDCNGLAKDGCETPTDTLMNCGACRKTCTFANAQAACTVGACALSSCGPGFGDCNKQPADGCEVDLRTALTSCGACGNTCAVDHGQPACSGSTCQVKSCDPGFDNCNLEPGDGCEADLTKPASCGSCTNVCLPGQNCIEGVCKSKDLILYGGISSLIANTPATDTFTFDPETKVFTKLVVATPNGDPGQRVFPAAVWDATGNRMLMFGGSDNQLWALDFNTAVPEWKKLTATNPPPARGGPAFGWNKEARKLWIFGGGDFTNGDPLSDVWVLDVATLAWSNPMPTGAGPDARYWTAFAWDSTEKALVVHGGFDGFEDVTGGYALATSGATPVWSEVPATNGPDYRYGHVGFPGAGKTYFFGGYDDFSQITYDEFYSLTLSGTPAWKTETGNAPGARVYATGTTLKNGALILMGGFDPDASSDLNDVWTYKDGAWSQLTVTYPGGAGRSAATLVSRE